MEEVTFITGYLGLGGAERVMSLLANYFVRQGIKVNVIAVISDKIDYELDNRISYYYIESRNKNRIVRIINKCYKLRKLIKSLGETKIISFLFAPILYTVMATMFLNNKIYVSERNNPYMEPDSKLKRKLRNLSYYFANKIIFQTEDAKEYFSEKIRSKGFVIPNPIKDDLPERFEGKRNKEIIAACRLDKQKNLKMLIDAYKLLHIQYSDYKLIIYGEGILRNQLEKYTKELDLDDCIKFPGFSDDIHNILRKCCMYVSSSNFEGISNSMLEALAMGVPSVITDCPIGGARMTIKNNENGILVPVGDEETFYKGMKKIIENVDFAEKLSLNAVKIKEKYNCEYICNQWLEIIM